MMLALLTAHPDLPWRRGMGGIYSASLPDGRRVQVWAEGEGYAGAVGRSPSICMWDLTDLLTTLTAPLPAPKEEA
jgi:hypothetical protein